MPTLQHELLIDLFRNNPSLAGTMLDTLFGVDIPTRAQARIESAELNETSTTEYHADAVVNLEGRGQSLVVVVEVQRGKDPKKRLSWPFYLAKVRARWNRPAILLVVCPDEGIAEWCAHPIHMGHPEWVLKPLVAGPGKVPVITDPELAVRTPELTVLSALAHGAGPRGWEVITAFASALRVIDPDVGRLYADYVVAELGEPVREYWEELMAMDTYQLRTDFAKRHYAEGEAEGEAKGEIKGEAKSLITVLTTRGVDISDSARQRIEDCDDPDQLTTRIQRALTVSTADELFA